MGTIFVKKFSPISVLTELMDVTSCDERHCVSKLDPQDFNIKTSLWAFKGYYPRRITRQRVKSNNKSGAYHNGRDSVTMVGKIGPLVLASE